MKRFDLCPVSYRIIFVPFGVVKVYSFDYGPYFLVVSKGSQGRKALSPLFGCIEWSHHYMAGKN